ncbi:Hsp20/alpha crystallin family protein [Salegentibacter sp. HM20]
MSLIKSGKSRSPISRSNWMENDPFFSDLMDTRKGIFNLNRIFNGDFDTDFTPAMNIKDRGNEYEIELAAPGLSKDDFKISIDNGMLHISVEKEESSEEKKEGYLRKEFSYNSFSRSLTLPDSIDEEKDVKAQYRDGVLKLELMKKDGARQKKSKSIKVS